MAPIRRVPRRTLAFLGIGAVVVFVALVIGEAVDTGQLGSPAGAGITATPSRLAPTYHPAISDYPLAQPDSVGAKDDRFFAMVSSLAERAHVPRARRAAMITAAHQVCAMTASGRSVTDASDALRVGYGFTDAQAQAVGAIGVQVYCPENRP